MILIQQTAVSVLFEPFWGVLGEIWKLAWFGRLIAKFDGNSRKIGEKSEKMAENLEKSASEAVMRRFSRPDLSERVGRREFSQMGVGNILGDVGGVIICNCMLWSMITVNMAKNGPKWRFGGFGGLKIAKN